MSQDLISLSEAAELIGKNLRTIQRHIKSGKLTRHDRDGKSYVSRGEVEEKFGKISSIKEKKVVAEKEPVIEQAKVTSKEEKGSDYQAKWIEEVQKHAETREELGVWKGRAEAYQAFASRLLGNGNVESVDREMAQSENKKSPVYKSIKTYTYLIYGLIGIFFIIILFFVLIVLKVI